MLTTFLIISGLKEIVLRHIETITFYMLLESHPARFGVLLEVIVEKRENIRCVLLLVRPQGT